LEKEMKIELSYNEVKYILHALIEARDYEYASLDAYRNVHDGSEKEPSSFAKRHIKKWNEIIRKLEEKQRISTKAISILKV
jgi:hypothetical protein